MGKGGFYTGEKKKQKKDKETKGEMQFGSNAPVFVLPKLIEKKKNATS